MDLYKFFDLEKDASKEQIKRTYRLYASKFHPDKHNGDPFFNEYFKKIQFAYERLLHPDKDRCNNSTFNNSSDKTQDLQNIINSLNDKITKLESELKSADNYNRELALKLKASFLMDKDVELRMKEQDRQLREYVKIKSELSALKIKYEEVIKNRQDLQKKYWAKDSELIKKDGEIKNLNGEIKKYEDGRSFVRGLVFFLIFMALLFMIISIFLIN